MYRPPSLFPRLIPCRVQARRAVRVSFAFAGPSGKSLFAVSFKSQNLRRLAHIALDAVGWSESFVNLLTIPPQPPRGKRFPCRSDKLPGASTRR